VRAGVAAQPFGVVGIRTCMSDDKMRDLGCMVSVADWTEFPLLVAGEEETAHAPSTEP
jgi:hypothetical protein